MFAFLALNHLFFGFDLGLLLPTPFVIYFAANVAAAAVANEEEFCAMRQATINQIKTGVFDI